MSYHKYWVNQPSPLQPYHLYHGMRVIVNLWPRDPYGDLLECAVLDGATDAEDYGVCTLLFPPYALAPGWRSAPLRDPSAWYAANYRDTYLKQQVTMAQQDAMLDNACRQIGHLKSELERYTRHG